MYLVNKQDGYIYSVVSGVSPEIANATEEEYLKIKASLENAPAASDGFYYRLREDFTWELCELPEVVEVATEADYLAALERFGVK